MAQTCNDLPVLNLILLVLGCLSLVSIVLVTIKFVIAYIGAKKDGTLRATKQWLFLSVLTIIFLSLANATMITTLVMCYVNKRKTIWIVSYIHTICWTISGVPLLYLFILRLHKVFKGTTFEFSNKTFGMLYTMQVLVLVFAAISIIVFILLDEISWTFRLGAFALIFYVALGFAILFLFIRGLFNVTVCILIYTITCVYTCYDHKRSSGQAAEH